MTFAVTFVGHSFPIPDTAFTGVDQTHVVLDVCTAVTPNYLSLKEIALFLTNQTALADPNTALGLYISVGGQEWQFRGYVSTDHPSEVMPLQWPINPQLPVATPGSVQIGVAIEPLDQLKEKEGSKLATKQEYAKLVARDLYRFMESFSSGGSGTHLVLPTNCLEQWFTKFDHKFRRDPDFLVHAGEKS